MSKDIYLNLMSQHEKVDIIDIGVGNGWHIVSVLNELLRKGKLNHYYGIDYSKDMLKIANSTFLENIQEYNEKIFSYHQLDITYDSIYRYLFKKNNKSIGKFIFFIGSTIENIRDYIFVLKLIKNSLNKGDIFILGNTLINNNAQELLNFNHNTIEPSKHRDGYYLALDRLGVTGEYYDDVSYYDLYTKTRFAKAKLKYDIEIMFKTNSFDRIVKLSRKDEITVYRHSHHSSEEIHRVLSDEGFKVLHFISSSDSANILLFCTI